MFLAAFLNKNDEMIKMISKVIAYDVRNNMEDFHVRNLSDKQMKEINPHRETGYLQYFDCFC